MTPRTPRSWLWPDRTIGKSEPRTLRVEHNAVVNSHAELLSALKELVELPNKKRPERFWDAARAAITRATRSKKENVQ